MRWRDLGIAKKLGVAFGSLLLLMMCVAFFGYSGIDIVSKALFVVGEQEAPIVAVANEMKTALMASRNAMEEYKGATAALATYDEEALEGIRKNYRLSLESFDLYANAILEGGRLESGDRIHKTDNPALAEAIRRADRLHDEKFQTMAGLMMQRGETLLSSKKKADAAMGSMEENYVNVYEFGNLLEQLVSEELQARAEDADVSAKARIILREEVPLGDMANEIKISIAESRIKLEEFVQKRDKKELAAIEREYQVEIARFDRILDAILNGGEVDGRRVYPTDNPEILSALNRVDKEHRIFQQQAEHLMAAHRDAISMAQAAEEAMESLDRFGREADLLLQDVGTLAKQEMAQAQAEGARSSSRATLAMVSVSAIALVLGALMGYFIQRSIAGPVAKAVSVFEEMEKGHLGERLEIVSEDEIGRMAKAMDRFSESLEQDVVAALQKLAKGDLSFTTIPRDDRDLLRNALKTLGEDLNAIIYQIRVAGEQVASGSGQVSDSSQSLSQGATEQAGSLEEITSSLTQIGSQIRQNAENAVQASQVAKEVRQTADKGNEQMGEMMASMREINAAGQNISKIIKVIDEIAFQTNLLALNAAVEAARAGQHGRGFAVVAEEVRNLAARSAKAAHETAELIEGSVEKAEKGSQTADRTAVALSEIRESVTRMTDLVGEIATACQEQSQGISQINLGLSQIDQVTQQNTANAEESAAAAQELSSQAAQMRRMLTRFTLSGLELPAARPEAPSDKQRNWMPGEHRVSANWGLDTPVIALDDTEFGKF